MPQIIAKENIIPWVPPNPNEAIAGPGHKPDKPPPIPKRTDPIMRS